MVFDVFALFCCGEASLLSYGLRPTHASPPALADFTSKTGTDGAASKQESLPYAVPAHSRHTRPAHGQTALDSARAVPDSSGRVGGSAPGVHGLPARASASVREHRLRF